MTHVGSNVRPGQALAVATPHVGKPHGLSHPRGGRIGPDLPGLADPDSTLSYRQASPPRRHHPQIRVPRGPGAAPVVASGLAAGADKCRRYEPAGVQWPAPECLT